MTDLKKLVDDITSNLTLGDHLYPDVQVIVEGKLRDRYDKLIGKKTRKEGPITEERIANTVHYATSGILEKGTQELVAGTADYYRIKYEIEQKLTIGYKVESSDFLGDITVSKVNILGGPFTDKDAPGTQKQWVISSSQKIWSAQRGPIDKDTHYGVVLMTRVYEDYEQAKNYAAWCVERARIKCHSRLQSIIDRYSMLHKVDVGTIPKEDYNSPFSGEKT